MAIVVDAARDIDTWHLDFATDYQKGNDNANTPTPTWRQSTDFQAADTVETHITARNDVTPWVAVDNTLDAWLPATDDIWLTSTPATVRPA